MKKNIIFIINPISGKGYGKILESKIHEFFKHKPFKVKTIFAEYAGNAIEIAKDQIKYNPDIIVACGGDGTINEVAQALVHKNIPLGIIPIGSGNGLASNLHIPKELDSSLHNLITNKAMEMDVCKVNDKFFFSNMGLGIDANVIHRYAQQKKRNFIGYFKASLWSFFNFSPIYYDITVDQVKLKSTEYFFVLCSNSNEAGYGISFTPNAKLNDGLIDVLCVEKLNILELVKFALAVVTKKLDNFEKAKLLQAKSIIFKSNQHSLKSQIDGEAVELNTSNIEVSILPSALKVIMPRS
ncbi:diacylglycerol/lipid kinase family protein [Faecalibacter rhinopitheci]|uniref:Diacylglycerol kinase family lipid kinase n=1 Tax=Faecalibacter rhinopitheci TaxID=2779678 RepID=A0A8J7FSL9_9FLAO|nr:diacylglycerol kinase family protein [Faecalibacter rhinopitheci]MBF0598108.1 diacylglycerol kinase family lipid kinase [Faecalibacter rhinopitheci]MBQ0146976.1 diacylglycerol kinase family lipid kinase [Candidatus Onthonaster equi]